MTGVAQARHDIPSGIRGTELSNAVGLAHGRHAFIRYYEKLWVKRFYGQLILPYAAQPAVICAIRYRRASLLTLVTTQTLAHSVQEVRRNPLKINRVIAMILDEHAYIQLARSRAAAR
eukprot:3669596-Pleurochrysis_carterae.AAC.10